jgi:hypothetical protein
MRVVCIIAWLFVSLGSAALVWAVPPDKIVLIKPGSHQFQAVPAGSWKAVSSDSKVVKIELFETNELFIEALAEGQALILLTNRVLGQVKVWKVRVTSDEAVKVDKPSTSLAKACSCGSLEKYPLTCQVKTTDCLDVLDKFISKSSLTASDIKIVYSSTQVIQALLQRIQQKVATAGFTDIKLSFWGANLRIQGKLSDPTKYHALLVAIYQGMIGKLVLDDKLIVGR